MRNSVEGQMHCAVWTGICLEDFDNSMFMHVYRAHRRWLSKDCTRFIVGKHEHEAIFHLSMPCMTK
jgi:hypothetical protein